MTKQHSRILCPVFKAIQQFLRALVVLVILGLILFFLGMFWFVRGFHLDSRSLETRLAFWMEHAWASGEETDFERLNQRIEDHNITDLYFHVGPLEEDGALANDLKLPNTEIQNLSTTNYAWIGQIRNKIDLDDPQVREGIISSCEWTLSQGFDGIHVDIEPIRPGDTAFVLLMQEMREALPEAKLSVAMDQWQPHHLTQWLANQLEREIISYWTSEQTEAVAEQVDQMVVMTYDTNMQDPKAYEWWVEQQTIALSKLMPKDTELFVGLPSYEEGAGINPQAENVQSGMIGFDKAISNVRTRLGKVAGIAIYSYWEMDDNEWEQLNEL